jgi:hypothetical protein
MSENVNADAAVSNMKLIASAVWGWLSEHPALLAGLFFVVGFLIG